MNSTGDVSVRNQESSDSEVLWDEGDQRPLIVHIVYRFDMGGLENGVVNVINGLYERQYRHAVVSLTDVSDFRQRLHDGVPVYSLHKQPGKDPALYWRIWRILRELKPDIVHSRNLNALEAQIPAYLAGVRGRIHGEHGWDVHDLDGRSARYRRWRRMFRPFVQRYIALSGHIEQYLRREVRVPAEKIVRICNGVDTQRFSPPKLHRDSLAGIEFTAHTYVVIGTVGRLEVVKDQITLAKAFVELLRRHPELKQQCRLVIVGEGSLRPAIEAVLTQGNVRDFAWLPGARDDIPAVLRALDIFVLPSRAEGISNTILEAMACGRPVVATDVGGNRELILDGETGAVVPHSDYESLADAMLRYVRDADLRKIHGHAARTRIEAEFSIERMVNRYAAVYADVLTTHGRFSTRAKPSKQNRDSRG